MSLVRLVLVKKLESIETIEEFDNFLAKVVFPDNKIDYDFIRETQVVFQELSLHESFLIDCYCSSEINLVKLKSETKIIMYGDHPCILDQDVITLVLSKKFVKYLSVKVQNKLQICVLQ
jgi:hypothetical protein